MIKAIIFDLNGVFIQSPYFSDIFCNKFAISKEEFLPALKETMTIVRQPGAKDVYHYWQPYLVKWGLNLPAKEFYNFWFSSEKEAVGLVDFAKNLKARGIKIIILSNNFRERTNYYEDNFECVHIFPSYYSWQTGFVKPDPKAYENILEKEKLKPEEVIYFDDSKENIEAAKSLGIQGYIFEQDKVKEIINETVDV